MAGTYAGILGPLAFTTVIARSAIHGAGVNESILQAGLSLFGFALIGYVLGSLAQQAVEESVRQIIEREIAASEKTANAAR